MPENQKRELNSWRRHIGIGKPFHEQRLWGYRDVRAGTNKYVDMSERLRIKAVLMRGYIHGLVELVSPGQWRFP